MINQKKEKVDDFIMQETDKIKQVRDILEIDDFVVNEIIKHWGSFDKMVSSEISELKYEIECNNRKIERLEEDIRSLIVKNNDIGYKIYKLSDFVEQE